MKGTVSLEAIINTKGRLENVRIIRGLPEGLNEAANRHVEDLAVQSGAEGR